MLNMVRKCNKLQLINIDRNQANCVQNGR